MVARCGSPVKGTGHGKRPPRGIGPRGGLGAAVDAAGQDLGTSSSSRRSGSRSRPASRPRRAIREDRFGDRRQGGGELPLRAVPDHRVGDLRTGAQRLLLRLDGSLVVGGQADAVHRHQDIAGRCASWMSPWSAMDGRLWVSGSNLSSEHVSRVGVSGRPSPQGGVKGGKKMQSR